MKCLPAGIEPFLLGTIMLRIFGVVCILVVGISGAVAKPASPPPAPSTPPAQSVFPSDADIQGIIDDRVVTYHDSVGLVVGVVEPAGRRVLARGPAQVGNDDTVDGDTIYEIGSITKVFTGLLLADMARRGAVAMTDPVAKYLPADSKLPQRGGRSITLIDLATHMSGLPKTLSNVAVTDFNNPNVDMTESQFLQSAQAFELTRDIGSAYEYSNAGYVLLALALADAGKSDYETLLRSRIFAPLHMKDTRLTFSQEEKDRTARGYDEHLNPVQRPSAPGLPGSDGMRSTANDLLNFLAAAIGLDRTPLAPAMADMIKVRRPTQYLELKTAIGWHVATLHGVDIVWHNGQTPGFRSFIGYAPQLRAGVVVLSNAASTIDDIGVHLLDPQTPLRKLYREVPVSPGLFDNYIGRYQVSDNFALSVSRDGGRLFIQGTGQPRAELFAESDNRFFLRVVNGEVVFETDSNGSARELSLTQDGKTVSAVRVR
jgi:CubicO group peptidase (beta-lactamase class C family)